MNIIHLDWKRDDILFDWIKRWEHLNDPQLNKIGRDLKKKLKDPVNKTKSISKNVTGDMAKLFLSNANDLMIMLGDVLREKIGILSKQNVTRYVLFSIMWVYFANMQKILFVTHKSIYEEQELKKMSELGYNTIRLLDKYAPIFVK